MDSVMSQKGGVLSFQKDVRDFVGAAEKLLSPVLRISPIECR